MVNKRINRQVIVELHNQGLNKQEIADRLNLNIHTVWYHLKKAGLKGHSISWAMTKRKPTLEFREELIKLYIEQKLSTRQIAPLIGVDSKSTVLGYLKRYGIAIRESHEANRIRLEKRLGYPPKVYGDRYETNWGYIMVRCLGHPRSRHHGFVLEHILVWERNHLSQLPKGWVVHHVNGVRNDNRPENLIAMPQKRHQAGLIKALRDKVRNLETEIEKLKEQLPLFWKT